MIVSHLTQDQIRELVSRFAAVDLGAWEQPDLARVLAEQGWPLIDRVGASPSFRTGLPTGDGHASLDAEHNPALTVTLAHHTSRDEAVEVFRAARRLAEDVLGPPALRGGGGPWLRWRRPDSTPCLRFVPKGDGKASVRLELLVTERYENREARNAQYLGEQPYSWCRIVHGTATEGMFFAGGDTAEDWGDFEHRLRRTVRDLAGDAVLLGEGPLVVVIEQDDDGSSLPSEIPTCFVRLGDGVLTAECPADPEPHVVRALTALGWEPPGDAWIAALAAAGDEGWTPPDEGSPNFSRVFPAAFPFPEEDAEATARLVAGALRGLGATLGGLTYRVLRDGSRLGIRLPRLGI